MKMKNIILALTVAVLGTACSDWFDVSPFSLKDDFAAVFAEGEEFCGLLEKDSSGYFKYSFVIN